MPKRARDTDDTPQDSEWVGCSVMLTPTAARGKRLPEAIVMKILRVARRGSSSKVQLEYDHEGETKQYTDAFRSDTPLSERYLKVVSTTAPMDRETFLAEWSFQGAAPCLPLVGRALGEVLPPFQLQTNLEQPIRIKQSDVRKRVSAVLACAIQPFQLEDVLRVSCGGGRFETEIGGSARRGQGAPLQGRLDGKRLLRSLCRARGVCAQGRAVPPAPLAGGGRGQSLAVSRSARRHA